MLSFESSQIDAYKFHLKRDNMLTLKKITGISDPLFTNLYNLYTLAFPPEERRTWGGLEHELNYEKRFSAQVLLQDNRFAGLLNYWLFESFCYIEHFAIVPTLRGQHIGTEAMEIFKSKINLPIIFEVEMPDNPIAIRRIKFYERLGYTVLPQSYSQPPYEGEGSLIQMKVMSSDPHFANKHFDMIKENLYNRVYHYDYVDDKEPDRE